jgi:hypothetical protein
LLVLVAQIMQMAVILVFNLMVLGSLVQLDMVGVMVVMQTPWLVAAAGLGAVEITTAEVAHRSPVRDSSVVRVRVLILAGLANHFHTEMMAAVAAALRKKAAGETRPLIPAMDTLAETVPPHTIHGFLQSETLLGQTDQR